MRVVYAVVEYSILPGLGGHLKIPIELHCSNVVGPIVVLIHPPGPVLPDVSIMRQTSPSSASACDAAIGQFGVEGGSPATARPGCAAANDRERRTAWDNAFNLIIDDRFDEKRMRVKTGQE